MDNTQKATLLNAALAKFDSTADARDKMWERAATNAGVKRAAAADAKALAKVQYAFWRVTREYNSRHNCGFITVQDARNLAAHFTANA